MSNIPQPSPNQVVLFSGHMIDRPGRATPRFPPEKEPAADTRITEFVERKFRMGANDLGICGGACGGDILFGEACLKCGSRLQIHIPFHEPRFLDESINFAGDRWRDRYFALKNHPNTTLLVMPDILGPTPDKDAFVRNNSWMLSTALSFGAGKVKFLCLWDGSPGDGPGGTKDMHDTIKSNSGQVEVIDPATL